MKRRIRLVRDPVPEAYRGDAETVADALHACGYKCSVEKALVLWERYSSSMCAGWMNVRNLTAGEIVERIRPFFEEKW